MFEAIMYNTYYYNCTYCKLDICGTCFQAGQHPWTHLPSMVRLNAKETKAGDRREDKQCENCKAMKHRRMDCDECPYSVCLSCYSNAAVPVHQHKSYQLKATPGLTLSVRRGDGSPCCTKPSFGHCGRCYSRKNSASNPESVANGNSLEARRVDGAMQDLLIRI